MRSLVRRAIIAATCLSGLVVLGAGCDAKQQTEYVTGFSTQVKVPRDLKSIVLQVSVGGVQVSCQAYKVYDGVVILPRSLGTYNVNSGSVGLPVTYTIIGAGTDVTDESTTANPQVSSCLDFTVGNNSVRVLRRSRQPYIENEIHFLPLPLKYSCFDRNCNNEETCKGGKCVPATVPNPKDVFPAYSPDLADGTGGTCFHVNQFTPKGADGKDLIDPATQKPSVLPGCLTGALPAVPVDVANCIYAVPGTPSAPDPQPGQTNPFSGATVGAGVNVEITYDGGFTKEILDKDPDEGFTIPDPTKPQRFQLAPGLCDMVHGTNGAVHAISAISTSGTCQAKLPMQPICLPDQLALMGLGPDGKSPTPGELSQKTITLKPAPAALMLVVDDHQMHSTFFTKVKNTQADSTSTDQDDFIGQAVNAVIKHPALSTISVGLMYEPAGVTTCNTPITPKLDLGANPADILTDLQTHATLTPVTTSSEIGSAIRSAQALLTGADYAARDIFVLANDFADPNLTAGCISGADASKQAHDASQINVYAVQIVKQPDRSLSNPDNNLFGQIAANGAAPDEQGHPAGTGLGISGATAKFASVLADLATCTYDVPAADLATPIAADAVVSYTDFQTGNVTELKNAVDFDVTTIPGAQRIILHGAGVADSPCEKLRNVFKSITQYADQIYGQPNAATVPIVLRTTATDTPSP